MRNLHSVFVIVAACNAVTYRTVRFLYITPATKSTKFGSRYLGEGLSERDKILQVAKGGWCTPPHTPVTFGPLGSPWEPKY